MTTEFLESLVRADRHDRQTRLCEHFLINVKGVEQPHRRCLGYRIVDDARLYYYRLSDGILEIEVCPDGQDYVRRVIDFISDPLDIEDMLGRDHEVHMIELPVDADPESVLFSKGG